MDLAFAPAGLVLIVANVVVSAKALRMNAALHVRLIAVAGVWLLPVLGALFALYRASTAGHPPPSEGQFVCISCKRAYADNDRSSLPSFAKWLAVFLMNRVLPIAQGEKEFCKTCSVKVYVLFIFFVALVVASPYLERLRDS